MPDENNIRVTNALLKKDIEEISKKLDVLPEMQRKLHEMDKKLAVTCKAVSANKEDIDDLQKKSNINDVIIGTGTIIAGIIGSLFGGNR